MTQFRTTRATCTLVLMLAVAATAGVSATADAPTSPAQGIAVTVDVVRDPSDPRQFTCTAEVKDLATGELLSVPKVRLLAGEPTKARSGVQAHGGVVEREIVLDAVVAADGNATSYTVTYTRSGQTVAVQKGSLTLR